MKAVHPTQGRKPRQRPPRRDITCILANVRLREVAPASMPTMAISDAKFDSEAELEQWVFANWGTFFGSSILLPKMRIVTPAGKQGVPDGIVFNFEKRAWWVIECELLTHGVWQHIAEQVTRFVVAARNP